MKKGFVKAISLIIVVVMCFMMSLPAFAQSNEEINRTCPKVYVHGFMAQDIYVDPDDPESEKAWPPSTDRIIETVAKAIVPLAKCAIDHDLNKFGSAVAPIVDELFDPACSDYNGEVSNGSGIRYEYPAPETIKTDSTVNFGYDWRLDPIVIASQLNDFINYVLKCSGSEQVVLECHSLGGVITNTYLRIYGNEKIKSVVFNSSAVYGETYTGELLKGQIELNADALKSFLDYCFDGTGYESILSVLSDMLADAGLLDFVCFFGDILLDGIYDEVIPSITNLFANWPTIWAMVPDEDIEEAEKYVFGLYDEFGVDYSGLKDKVQKYNADIRPYKTATLKKTAKTSNLYVISRYGYSSIPVTPTWTALGDGVVDTKYSSFGATTAPYGEILKDSNSKYISPDKTVDASTCLFPEQTWFIKNMKHADYINCLEVLVDKLLYHDGLATVETFEEYARFMKYDYENSALLIDKGLPEPGFFNVIRDKLFAAFEK